MEDEDINTRTSGDDEVLSEHICNGLKPTGKCTNGINSGAMGGHLNMTAKKRIKRLTAKVAERNNNKKKKKHFHHQMGNHNRHLLLVIATSSFKQVTL